MNNKINNVVMAIFAITTIFLIQSCAKSSSARKDAYSYRLNTEHLIIVLEKKESGLYAGESDNKSCQLTFIHPQFPKLENGAYPTTNGFFGGESSILISIGPENTKRADGNVVIPDEEISISVTLPEDPKSSKVFASVQIFRQGVLFEESVQQVFVSQNLFGG